MAAADPTTSARDLSRIAHIGITTAGAAASRRADTRSSGASRIGNSGEWVIIF